MTGQERTVEDRRIDRVALAVALVSLLTAAGYVLVMTVVALDCHLLSSEEDPCAGDGSVRTTFLWILTWVTGAAGSLVVVRALLGASRRQSIVSGSAVIVVSVPLATVLAWDGRYPESISVATVLTGIAGAALLARGRR